MYETMFREIEAKCAQLGIDLDPLTIVADFEIVSYCQITLKSFLILLKNIVKTGMLHF